MNATEIQNVQFALTTNPEKIVSVTIAYGDATLTKTFVAATPPPPPPVPNVRRIVQDASRYAYQQTNGDLSIADTVITQGGLVHSIGGKNLTLKRCWSEGAADTLGVYFAIVATGPGRVFLWDNTGAPDRWICHGPDAALRVMGDCQSATIINVDFVTRLHESGKGTGPLDPNPGLAPIPQLHPLKQPTPPAGKKYTLWKQAVQVRDVRKCVFQGTLPNAQLPDGQGRIVGLMDVGMQSNPTTPQKVDDLTIQNYGLENPPHLTDPKSYGTVRMISCFKIDSNGHALKDSQGKVQMWPDKTWRGK